MLDQEALDQIADRLVEDGVRVTYDSINDQLKEADRRDGGSGQGKSDRDLQVPLADWKRRRRYRPFLSHIDLPADLDRAIASLVTRATTFAQERKGSGGTCDGDIEVLDGEPLDAIARQFADHSGVMQAQMVILVNDVRTMRDHVVSSFKGGDAGMAPAPLRSEDRRRGLTAATGRFFWDRMMRSFVVSIRHHGPMTAADLIETLDDDAMAMAGAVFEKVSVSVIKAKMEDRVVAEKYFRRAGDDTYDVLPKHAARPKKAG